jgi:hypothetical protein
MRHLIQPAPDIRPVGRSPAARSPAIAAPGLAPALRGLWQRLIATHRRHAEEQALLASEEERLLAGTLGREGRTGYAPSLREQAERLAQRITDLAAARLTPAGFAPIDLPGDVPRAHLRRAVGKQGAFEPEHFDPGALWDALMARCGPEAAAEQAYRRVARQLRGLFGLRNGAAVRRRGRHVVLEHGVSMDDWDRDRLCWHSAELVFEVAGCLAQFAVWADRADLRPGLDGLRQALDRRIASRARLAVGEGLVIVTYKSKFELSRRLDPVRSSSRGPNGAM